MMVCLLYFNPRSPWGERRARQSNTRFAAAFQSTLPVGGATRSFLPLFLRVIYFNPRSPWGERRHLGVDQAHFLRISIHAPRGGSDFEIISHSGLHSTFQSTLPVGGATWACPASRHPASHFNPRSPWGERRAAAIPSALSRGFQSTLPVGGATGKMFTQTFHKPLFQSTLPVGGATFKNYTSKRILIISIHAPRGGSDKIVKCIGGLRLYFNPRSPWGERLIKTAAHTATTRFQSTLPVGGATNSGACSASECLISIHAPRGGSDQTLKKQLRITNDFNPRSPWGERQFTPMLPDKAVRFQSTLPVGGATSANNTTKGRQHDFNPRSPWGERPGR